MNDTCKYILLPRTPRVIQRVQVERPHAGQEIHLVCPDKESASEFGHGFPEEIEGDDEGCGEVFLEESCRGTGGSSSDRL